MNKPTLILNFITIVGMILYAFGIYLETAILGRVWGNSIVNLAIQILGPLFGIIIVTLIEIGILAFAYSLSKLDKVEITIAPNIFLCWFWILSLYQCAINSFLSFYGLPNEPINLFFKTLWPYFWYPMKELAFISISIVLTWYWCIKIEETSLLKVDIILISLVSVIMWSSTAMSQISLINSGTNVYS